MTRYLMAMGGMLLVMGCSGATSGDAASGAGASPEETAPQESIGTARAELTGWLGPISDESGINNRDCSQADIGVTEGYCSGSNCDDNWQLCTHLPTGVHSAVGSATGNFISEEAPNNSSFCVDSNGFLNGVVTGLSASGDYSDNIELHCGAVHFDASHSWKACQWTGWFSEEQGYDVFPPGTYATGIACNGGHCDNVRYYVCSFT